MRPDVRLYRSNEVFHRDLRLPDERPRLRADGGVAGGVRLRARARRRATPTWWSSTPAACARRPRRSSTRGSATSRAWSARPATRRSSRSPAASRSRRARACSSGRTLIDVVVGTQRVKMLPMLVEQARARRRTRPRADRARRHRRRLDAVRRAVVSARPDAPRRSGQGVRDHHRRLQRLLRLLRRAVHARARADAGEGGDSRRRAARRGHRAARRSSCSARSSITTRRPTIPRCDFRRPARGGQRRAGRAAHPLCQPASAARVGSADRGGSRSAGGLQAHPPAGAVRARRDAAAHAAPPHARAVPRSGRRGSAPPSRRSSYRPI